jgi:hypothetical protein
VSREIDALVAERVFGLEVQKDQHTLGWLERPKPDDPFDYYLGKSNDKVPAYSTSIEEAWKAVEWLKQWHTVLIEVDKDKTKVMAGEWTKYEGFWPNYQAEGSFCDAACDVALQWAARLEEINKPDEESA